MNRAILTVLLACSAASVAACGGEEIQQLTAAEAQAIADSLSASLAGAGARTTRPLRTPRDAGVAVNGTLACPVSGHVFSQGNLFVSCPNPPTPGSCTVSGVVSVNFGNAVSNVEDCTYASGLVVDGGVTVMFSGTDLAMKITFTSILSVARKGPTGGLIPLDICLIDLVARTPAKTLTGSICGQPVNSTL